jgi:hypothetical protein
MLVGGADGDPHIKTWNGTWFDYHGECDLVFVHAPDFGEGIGLDLHIRTTIRYAYSFISSAVLKIGQDTLEVASFGVLLLNGVSGAKMPNFLAGKYPVTHTQPSSKLHLFDVQVGEKQHIVLKAFKDLVGVKVIGATHEDFGTSVGLMGRFGDGKMLGRDGTTVLDYDPAQFAKDWQVRETMIFEATRSPQYPQPCILPSTKAEARHRRLGASIVKDQAEKVCAKWNKDDDQAYKNCVYDVLASGDLEIAEAGGF